MRIIIELSGRSDEHEVPIITTKSESSPAEKAGELLETEAINVGTPPDLYSEAESEFSDDHLRHDHMKQEKHSADMMSDEFGHEEIRKVGNGEIENFNTGPAPDFD